MGESVADPAKYYFNNVVNSLNLLEMMRRYHISPIIFSSSAAIFGLPQQDNLSENHPCSPINPYGKSKYMIEQVLKDYDLAYGVKFSCLRYFNAAGGDPEVLIKNVKKKESNLIPLILRHLKIQSKDPFTIFGHDYSTPDGTCIRDYIHVEDLGSAHILAMEKLFKDQNSSYYNLGNGHGFSVREVISAADSVTGLKLNVIEGKRRLGDPPRLVANSEKAKRELGWYLIMMILRS